jgi:hypothetical protein
MGISLLKYVRRARRRAPNSTLTRFHCRRRAGWRAETRLFEASFPAKVAAELFVSNTSPKRRAIRNL